MQTSPPAVRYEAVTDLLVLKMHPGEELPAECVMQPVDIDMPPVMRLTAMVGMDDARIYAFGVSPASIFVPAGVIRAAPTPIAPVETEPDTWLLPLFDGAQRAAAGSLPLDLLDGWPPVTLLLANSGRMVGLTVPAARRRLVESLWSGDATPPHA